MTNTLKLIFLLLILFSATSCSEGNSNGNSLDAKLENLKLASKEDLVRLGELELNSSNVPVYDPEGNRLNDRQLLEILESKQYRMDYYLDEDERLGAAVLHPLAADTTQASN